MTFVDKDGTTKVYIPVHPWAVSVHCRNQTSTRISSYSLCIEIWCVPGWGGTFSSMHNAARILCKGCLDPGYDHMQ